MSNTQMMVASDVLSCLTMSSLEISDLVEKRHDNVCRTIIRLSETGVIRLPHIEEFKKANNLGHLVTRKRFVFSGEQGKRDSIVVVAQLSPEFTARLVDRWQELEGQQKRQTPQFNIPTTLSGALRLAAEQAETIEQQQALIEAQKPAVQFVESYVESTGLKGFREVAKLLNVKENTLRDFLTQNKIMYKLGSDWVAYQCHIDAGRFSVKTGVSNSNGHAYNASKFTPKGIAWLAGIMASHGALAALECKE